MTLTELRNSFPALSETVYGKPLVYLDNAATSQRPESVIDKCELLARSENANIHRAVHYLAGKATDEYESTRDVVRAFINAESREEIIFTSGTTAAINLVAFSFGEAFVREGDEIIIAVSEHHSDIVPWQLMAQRKGAIIKVLPVDDRGQLDLSALRSMLSERTRLVCVAQISNVLGLRNPIKEIVNICHSVGCPVLTDGAQGIVHGGVDVRDLDCDFYVFSGHKIYAATGTGVLYGKKKWLEQMPPYMGGGEMIATVKFSGTSFAPLPGKFEAGTQNFNHIPSLKPALEMAERMRDPEIAANEAAVCRYVYDALGEIPGLTLYGTTDCPEEKIPLFSFTIEGVHHEDLALILDKMGVAVRSGQMCAEPIMDRFGVTGMLRASFAPYNTMAEAEYFISSLKRAADMLK